MNSKYSVLGSLVERSPQYQLMFSVKQVFFWTSEVSLLKKQSLTQVVKDCNVPVVGSHLLVDVSRHICVHLMVVNDEERVRAVRAGEGSRESSSKKIVKNHLMTGNQMTKKSLTFFLRWKKSSYILLCYKYDKMIRTKLIKFILSTL